MLISLALHLILLMFELLVCDKLESGRHLWVLVFIPLIFISIVSIPVCIWAVRHDRSFEVIAFRYRPYVSNDRFFPAARAVLRREHFTIYIPRFTTGRFHFVELGGRLRAAVDNNVFIARK